MNAQNLNPERQAFCCTGCTKWHGEECANVTKTGIWCPVCYKKLAPCLSCKEPTPESDFVEIVYKTSYGDQPEDVCDSCARKHAEGDNHED